jgi:hypothetical protein
MASWFWRKIHGMRESWQKATSQGRDSRRKEIVGPNRHAKGLHSILIALK